MNKRREFLKNSGLLLGGLLLSNSKVFSRSNAAYFTIQPFLSEIAIYAFNYAPKGWAKCDGQLLLIAQNQALFSLLGTNYGGDGRVNFGLPDLRGRAPMHFGNENILGARGGEVAHTLLSDEMPMHNHGEDASMTQNIGNGNTGLTDNPIGTYPAGNSTILNRFSNVKDESMELNTNSTSTGNYGGSQAHNNMQPYLCLNFCIALLGIFPSPN